jgi:DNA-damage-inducible protein J
MRASTSIRIDNEAKAITIEVLKQYGLSLSDGINLFCKQVALTHSIPFELKVPQERMKVALEELEAKNGEKFKNMEDLKRDLLS